MFHALNLLFQISFEWLRYTGEIPVYGEGDEMHYQQSIIA